MSSSDDYVSRSGQEGEAVQVQPDDEPIRDATTSKGLSSSNAQIGRDEKDVIKEGSNVESQTRDEGGPQGGYAEPGDREGLPANDGRSRIAQ